MKKIKTAMDRMIEFLIKNPTVSQAEKITKAIELRDTVEKTQIMIAAAHTFPEIVQQDIGEEYFRNMYADSIINEDSIK